MVRLNINTMDKALSWIGMLLSKPILIAHNSWPKATFWYIRSSYQPTPPPLCRATHVAPLNASPTKFCTAMSVRGRHGELSLWLFQIILTVFLFYKKVYREWQASLEGEKRRLYTISVPSLWLNPQCCMSTVGLCPTKPPGHQTQLPL